MTLPPGNIALAPPRCYGGNRSPERRCPLPPVSLAVLGAQESSGGAPVESALKS